MPTDFYHFVPFLNCLLYSSRNRYRDIYKNGIFSSKMIGEIISTACPPLDLTTSGSRHPWHVKITAREGRAFVKCCNGFNHIPSVLGFGGPPFYHTRKERLLKFNVKSYQSWCDKKNQKLAKDSQKLIWRAAGILKGNDKERVNTL